MSKKALLSVGKIAATVISTVFQISISKEENKEAYNKGYDKGFEDYPLMLAEEAKKTGDALIHLENGDVLAVRYEKVS